MTAEQKTVYEICRQAGTLNNGQNKPMLPGAKEPKVTDGEGIVHNLNAAQYYDYQGNYNALYWQFAIKGLPQVTTDAEKRYILEKSVEAAHIMAGNAMLIQLGAETTKDYKKYEDLQLYSIPVSTYLVAKAKTKDITSLKDRRAGKTIPNSQGALIAEVVRDMNLNLPDTNMKRLLSKLDVGDTVLEWNETRLKRKLREFRKDAGIE